MPGHWDSSHNIVPSDPLVMKSYAGLAIAPSSLHGLSVRAWQIERQACPARISINNARNAVGESRNDCIRSKHTGIGDTVAIQIARGLPSSVHRRDCTRGDLVFIVLLEAWVSP